MITAQDLSKAARELISEGTSPVEVVTKLTAFAEGYNLSNLLPRVLELLEHEDKQLLEINTVVIETVIDLTEDQIKSIKSQIGASDEVPVRVEKKDSILGGYNAYYNNQMFSGDLGHNVARLERVLAIKE